MTNEERKLKAALRIQSNFRKQQAKLRVGALVEEKRKSQRRVSMKMEQERWRKRVEFHQKLDLNESLWSNLKQKEKERDGVNYDTLRAIEKELRNSIRFQRQFMAIIKPTSTFCIVWHSMVFGFIFLENIPKLLTLLGMNEINKMIHSAIMPINNARILMALNVLYLLDVMVDFFTGRFNEDGELVPERVWIRWVPLISKTTCNPITASFVKAIGQLCFVYAGPSRMLRWLLTFIIPFGNYTLSMLIWLWLVLVQKFNGELQLINMKSI